MLTLFKTSLRTFNQLLRRQIVRLKPLLPLTEAQWSKLDLLKALVQRDLEARYKGSILGNLWALVRQLAQLLIYTYVFSVVLQVKLSDRGLSDVDTNVTFGLWLFAGLLPWLTFSSGLSLASRVVLQQKNLVTKIIFPLELLPLVPVLSSFLESTFGLLILILFSTILSQTLHSTLLLLPLVWLPQLLLTIGLAYLAAALTVFIRDIPQILGIVLNLWFYATPIFYPLELVPEPIRTLVSWLNPLTAIVAVHRDVVLFGAVSQWQPWLVSTGLSVAIFLLGYWTYQKLRTAFPDVL
ncbi:MAG: ABC transporter permease [Cyanobacteria bacterium P01_D01_bin.56]